jgi:hypothetical protein
VKSLSENLEKEEKISKIRGSELMACEKRLENMHSEF